MPSGIETPRQITNCEADIRLAARYRHMPPDSGAGVVAVDHEVVTLGLSGNSFENGRFQPLISFAGTERDAKVGGIVLPETHEELAGTRNPDPVATLAEIMRQGRYEADPGAGLYAVEVASRSTGPIGRLPALQRPLSKPQPISLIALLTTLVLLFGFQGDQILAQPTTIVLLAVPILIQVYFNSGLAYLLNRACGEQHCVAAPSALIGASNFFELAVAAAISLFGLQSGVALATVVGVLIEVPVMLLVVKIVNSTKGWYERGRSVRNSKSPVSQQR